MDQITLGDVTITRVWEYYGPVDMTPQTFFPESLVLNGETRTLAKGDLFVVPSWAEWSLQAATGFDLFRFSDAPIFERLNFSRTYTEGRNK